MHRRIKNSGHGGSPPSKGTHERRRRSSSLIKQFESSRPARPSPLAASAIRDIPLDLLDRIRAFPLFSSAPDSFLSEIGSYLRPQIFSPQECILSEGEEAKALYFLVRGGVVVTSKDQESVFAELRPGAFFGEIAILMDMPRTANVVAQFKSLVVRLNKEDLKKILPKYPAVEQALLEEAAERLAILRRRKEQHQTSHAGPRQQASLARNGKRTREYLDPVSADGAQDASDDEEIVTLKRRKAPSPTLIHTTKSSALSSGLVQIRPLLKKLPLFTDMPSEVLHFLGLNAQLRTYPPFTNIITEGSHGREIFFITSGEVEVLTMNPGTMSTAAKARLSPGEYFGEVVSLSLSPKRTATVRSIIAVECLTILGDVLDELWRRCPPHVKDQIETTAKRRLRQDPDVQMLESGESTLAFGGLALDDSGRDGVKSSLFIPNNRTGKSGIQQHIPGHNPTDSDPFRTAEWSTHRRQRSRRASADNIPPQPSPLTESDSPRSQRKKDSPYASQPPSRPVSPFRVQHSGGFRRQPSTFGQGPLPDSVLIKIFGYLSVGKLMQCRAVSLHWSKLLSSSPDIFNFLDLSEHSRTMTDDVLINAVCPFVGQRPHTIVISDCHHITDEGFSALVAHCSTNVKVWQMRSVWDISPHVILELADKAHKLVAIDFSNVRKVSDNLLGLMLGAERARQTPGSSTQLQVPQQTQPPPRGCPNLTNLRLSYCKGVSNRFMHMAAAFAASQIVELDLTRCTAITDAGFQFWAQTSFPRLRKLVLADCTYLSDAAMQSLAHAAPWLCELDLSFCCALSDAALTVLCRSLTRLQALDIAFCGSAVSDNSLRCIATSLKRLERLSVRGCVRVTGVGVEAVLFGCGRLAKLDISQCVHVLPWLDSYRAKQFVPPRVKLCTLADGRWRAYER